MIGKDEMKMKRVLAICLVMLMALSMSVSVLAAPKGFVESPTGRPAPGMIKFDPQDDDCTAELIVTPYGDRDELPEEYKKLLEDAYQDVVGTDDLTKLNDDLKNLAKDKNLKGDKLAVSDLFNLHVEDCDDHDGHKGFDVVLDADTLKNFVALMYMNEDGQWVLVKDAAVVNNGDHLSFTIDELDSSAPFAIVVNTGAEGTQPDTDPDDPKTGDISYIHIYVTIMAVSALALGVILVVSKKRAA